MNTLRICVALLVTLGWATFAACTSSGEGPTGPMGGLPTSSDGPPALEEYLGILGEYAEAIEALQDQPAPSESEYRKLVARYREQGMEGLPTEDRQLLLAVAQAAFEAYPDTLRYSVAAKETAATTGEVREGQAVLEEVYRHPPAVPPLAARRLQARAIVWEWVSDPLWHADAPDYSVGFVGEGSSESEFVSSTIWEKSEGRWTCATGRTRLSDFAVAEVVRVGRLQDYVLGELLGLDTIDGRATYKFHNFNRTTGREITYWLDAETLWLRRYEYEGPGVLPAAFGGAHMRYTVKLEAVNEDIRIEPPDVDVVCTEETASGQTAGP
jgi:hypothetical protein